MRRMNRRDFLKIGALGISAAALGKIHKAEAYLPEFPQAQRLGRTFYTVEIKSKPDPRK